MTGRIDITAVRSRRDLRRFVRVPWHVYRDDPNWVPPLLVERMGALSPGNPFFQHARWQAWIALRDGQPVGRISAQVDDLYLEYQDPHTGFFGMIESVDDRQVFAALFAAVERWLKEQGMRRVVGPFNLGINQEVGVLVDGFTSPPFIMMGHAKPYYGPAIEDQGYARATDMLAYQITADGYTTPPFIERLLSRQSSRLRVRPLDKNNVSEELEVMRDIFNDAWANNWGFVPFTSEEFKAVGKEMLMLVPGEFLQIAEVDGRPAAFSALLPNINEAIADLNGRLAPFGWLKLLWRLKVRFPKTARLALLGVRESYQQTRLGPALAFLVIKALLDPAAQKGVRSGELSWVLEDNSGVRSIIEAVGGVVSKRYRMYEKTLEGQPDTAAAPE